MSRTSLLLLAIILVVSAMTAVAQTKSSGTTPMVATAESPPVLDSGSTSQSFQLTPASPRDDGAILPSDDVCYKIRAYIFKRDDDRAPEFVRSTTCGPRRPHTKNVGGPKAKIVPAN